MQDPKFDFDREVKLTGERIFQLLDADQEASGKSVFNKDWWYGRIMDWSMKNESFKVQMFRFVDVLPNLTSSQDVAKHLKEYFADLGEESSGVLNFGLGVGSLAPGIMAAAIRKNITQMARMFITGETPQDALKHLRASRENSIAFTVDLLGEATLSEKEALEYQTRYVELIHILSKDAESWTKNELTDCDGQGSIPKVNISVKLTSLYSQVSDRAWEQTKQTLKERLRPIFQLAKERGVFVNIDMEQYAYKNLTIEIFRELISEPEFSTYPHWGIVIQAYLRDSLADIKSLSDFAKIRGVPFTVRLVKGAYWDYETIHADQLGWPIPVFLNKKESDANFENCATYLLENHPHIRLAAGTHNVRSIAAVAVKAKQLGIDARDIEFQMLYGMADPIKKAMLKLGYRVREYATVGDLIPGMAYLVRRLLENTSNESFLRSKFADQIETEVLLTSPHVDLVRSNEKLPSSDDRFHNMPPLDWTKKENQNFMKAALANVRSRTPYRVRPVVNGKEISSKEIFERENPSQFAENIAKVELAGVELADQAVSGAKEAFREWSQQSAEHRAQVLEKVANIFLRDRFEIMALQVFEVGKNWADADGDVTEAIDFCRYYAREIRRLSVPENVSPVLGESSMYAYKPRGVSLVIAPWNFPLAILTGQVAASIVTGNTCIMKPAEQSSATAQVLMKALQEAGCPKNVVQFLPGMGETVGRYLVNHKDISIVSFTGSLAVGLEIVKASATLPAKQNFVKKCIIEMGGKNAIIVDSDADLDEAVDGVLYSAFGFQGQKCSACSRVIVLESIYERFIERLVEAARSLPVLESAEPKSVVGPVVDRDSYERIQGTIEKAKSQARLAYSEEAPNGGYFIGPHIFTEVNPQSELAQEEIFGPVLAVIRAKDLDEALHIANDVKYALTGGIYSRSPVNIARAKAEMECGNMYVNRSITGALVGRHPFGGYKLSGLGSKTGGKDYLQQYMEPTVVTENTMRRGFAPEVTSASASGRRV